ncbi:putative ABC transporter ATP-binding protein YknY [bioreactor metagenome]|mgnify:CR=1 FL=1|jgi:putative ABC transport system ATP-binding protein|uniref:Putative ABC transporter ATP-binding protein YknY n=1 Tax=bioreactor metagenome TaxID=1076179 RepID=A0A644TZT7_9ZZZZ|nr:ABC transporter ATP-binding protein [Bacteroidales bacterium]MBP8677497.1 ABC transporter ATP-binding protein [Bacteroidales bacterium]MBP9584117.1 ABC transporter ATP-binding protein [Bacteroidales bacterium]MBP9977994.1 ABC transporter ATP-binding protein [Bacteroidales bacterium]WRQ33917.1 ABC transporter ATP-binding protein [Bacteroidales bacterium MB20-C3-3]
MSNEVINIKDIKKIYKVGNQEVRALDGVDLHIGRNEYVAIMGPSGSGKSTMMNILGCLDSPSSGQYILNGTDVSSMADSQLAEVRNKEIGFIFQSFNLLPRYSALENVALPLIYSGDTRTERERRAEEALESVDLTDRMHHKPNELSGGQRQRVAVARALVNNPSMILADEPTGNLDTKTSVDIMKLFAKIHNKGNTIIVVTHEEDIARHAHRIIRLRDGKIESDEINHNPVKYS